MSLPRVAIALGDPAGIGPEIALKAASDMRVTRVARPLLVGDLRALEFHARACGLPLKVDAFGDASQVEWRDGRVPLVARSHFDDAPLEPGQIRAVHGLAALDAAGAAIRAALDGHVDAVVAAPQTETAIKAAGIAFDGYPGFVARATGTPEEDAFLMLCFDDGRRETRIVHTTLHSSLRVAIERVTEARVGRAIAAAHATLTRIGVATPRIAVSGLNPHAGEDGMFGDEEARIIAPAVAAARATGIAASGPFGCDTMFARDPVDAFVVMFHDQGHIAAKLLAPNRTAGLTIGTPVLFSSVAHGSALDIAGQGRAEHAAMVEAIARLCPHEG
ncbi:MAG: PdxA family protein [Burkholderiales bacterium]